jgi:hypothetical protein
MEKLGGNAAPGLTDWKYTMKAVEHKNRKLWATGQNTKKKDKGVNSRTNVTEQEGTTDQKKK